MIFSNDELHIILKRRNVEICEQSIFLIIDESVFYIKVGVKKLKKLVNLFNILFHLIILTYRAITVFKHLQLISIKK